MFFSLLLISVNALLCDTYQKRTIQSNQIYMLTESWIGGKCRVEDCSIPEGKTVFETDMIIESLSVLDNGKKMECCDYDGRRTDIETYVPQLLKYNHFYQNRLAQDWTGYSDCDIAAKAYVQYGTCMPEQFQSPYGYFNATTKLYQNYNVWGYLRNYIYNIGEEYLYSVDKLNDLLSVRNFPSKVQFLCAKDTNMLTGVNVCFTMKNKELIQTECPTVEGVEECGKFVYFPEKPEEKKTDKCAF